VRVNSDNQTLILAGEAIPRRGLASLSANAHALNHGAPPLTIVATPADDTKLLARGDFAGSFSAANVESTSPLKTLTAYQHSLLRSSPLASRGSSFNAANEYARTQDLSNPGMRTAIIDTYA
jgi:hypothetical protein